MTDHVETAVVNKTAKKRATPKVVLAESHTDTMDNAQKAQLIVEKKSLTTHMKAVDSLVRTTTKFNRFVDDPTSAIPKNFRTIEFAKIAIEKWQQKVTSAGTIGVDEMKANLEHITADTIQADVAAKKVELTTVRRQPVRLNDEQQELLDNALLKYAKALEIAIKATDEYKKAVGMIG